VAGDVQSQSRDCQGVDANLDDNRRGPPNRAPGLYGNVRKHSVNNVVRRTRRSWLGFGRGGGRRRLAHLWRRLRNGRSDDSFPFPQQTSDCDHHDQDQRERDTVGRQFRPALRQWRGFRCRDVRFKGDGLPGKRFGHGRARRSVEASPARENVRRLQFRQRVSTTMQNARVSATGG
jgi:hypothetical protein